MESQLPPPATPGTHGEACPGLGTLFLLLGDTLATVGRGTCHPWSQGMGNHQCVLESIMVEDPVEGKEDQGSVGKDVPVPQSS